MVNLKTFVEQRQHGEVSNEQRQAIGDQHRIPIQPTRLNRTASFPGNRPFDSETLPQLLAPFMVMQESNRGQRSHGFDTDPGSLDVTTTMSISPEDDGHSQVIECQLPSKVTSGKAGRRSGDSHNEPGYHQKSLAWIFDKQNTSEDGSDVAHETVDGRIHDGCSVPSGNVGHIQDEASFQFKKHNLLDKEFESASSRRQDRGSKSDLATSLFTPVKAQPIMTSSSSRSLTPSLEHVGHLLSSSPRPLKRDIQEDTNNRGFDSMPPTAPPLANQLDRGTLAGVVATGLLPTRAFRPSSQHGSGCIHSACNTTKLEHVYRYVANENYSHCQVNSAYHNHDRELSQLSDDDSAAGLDTIIPDNNARKRKQSLDHSPIDLKAMTFRQLADEPFEGNAPSIASGLGTELPDTTLYEKLEQLSLIKDLRGQHAQHQAFYNKLSIGQYIECGDIIGKMLSEVIVKLNQIRKQKRDNAGVFQKEIAKREVAVNDKIKALTEEKAVMTRRTEQLTAKRTI